MESVWFLRSISKYLNISIIIVHISYSHLSIISFIFPVHLWNWRLWWMDHIWTYWKMSNTIFFMFLFKWSLLLCECGQVFFPAVLMTCSALMRFSCGSLFSSNLTGYLMHPPLRLRKLSLCVEHSTHHVLHVSFCIIWLF